MTVAGADSGETTPSPGGGGYRTGVDFIVCDLAIYINDVGVSVKRGDEIIV